MKKSIIYIFIFSLFGLFILSSCQKKNEEVVANIEDLEYSDQEGWNSTIISTKNGIVGAIIKYGHMQRFKKRKVAEFDGRIVIDFFDEQGIHKSNLTSEKGRLDEANNNIEAFGNVVVVSDTGITLMTERLRWDNSIEKIVSNEFVTIITADQDTFYGNGFESDQNLENWNIKSFSGKASKGLNLDFQFNKKKQTNDSGATELKSDSLTTSTEVKQ